MADHAYQRTLPRKRMSAGALFFDEAGRVLLVNPTYKPEWEIPGGVVEQGESPLAGCMREVAEELGLAKRPFRLWCVDYLPQSAEKTEALVFLFDGGTLTPAEIAAIRLPTNELSHFRFCTLAEAQARLNPRLSKRVAQCLAHPGATLYLENQELVFV